MICDKCGCELPDFAVFCSNCGNRVKRPKNKNIYIAVILTFIFTGLGSVYAGKTRKGLILMAARAISLLIGQISDIFLVLSLIIWALAFYIAYRDVRTANGVSWPWLIRDLRNLKGARKAAALIIVAVVFMITVAGIASCIFQNSYSPGYYSSSSGGSSHSHYGGVDTSPYTIAKNDPDWYYDHYEYGDNMDIDDYLESQGYE